MGNAKSACNIYWLRFQYSILRQHCTLTLRKKLLIYIKITKECFLCGRARTNEAFAKAVIMDSTPFEAVSSETEPTLQSADDSSSSFSIQMIINMIFLILGIPANVSAIFFVWRKSGGFLSPVMPFLINLAVADLLVLAVYVPFYMAYEAFDFVWPFGNFLCKTVFSLTHISMYASLATLTTIAMERYFITFSDPIKKRTVKYLIIIIWVAAISLCIPQLIYLKTIQIDTFEDLETQDISPDDVGPKEDIDINEDKYICGLEWPHSNVEIFLQPIDAIILYLIPLFLISVLYAKIIRKLSAIDRENFPSARLAVEKKRRCAVRKMVTIIAIFALFHLPIHVFHFIRVFFYDSWEVLTSKFTWLFSLCVNLVLVTHVINPLVYGSVHHCFGCTGQVFKCMNCRWRLKPVRRRILFPLMRRSNTQQTPLRHKQSSG